MPKDRRKYRYFEVGLERTSWALTKLEEDAKGHHMSDQPGKLIALRLTEYYGQKERSVPLTSDSQQPPTSIQRSSEQKGREDNTLEEIIEVSENASANADEAADYWTRISS